MSARILDLLAISPLSRGDIALKLGISRATASAEVAVMLANGVIASAGTEPSFGRKGIGRPRQRFLLSPSDSCD